MFEVDHVCRRQTLRGATLGLDSWLGSSGVSSGGGGVFAVGIPGQAVVLGMECYRCHVCLLACLLRVGVEEVRSIKRKTENEEEMAGVLYKARCSRRADHDTDRG